MLVGPGGTAFLPAAAAEEEEEEDVELVVSFDVTISFKSTMFL